MGAPSKHEAKFSMLWKALKGPPIESEFQFHDTRRWRFDFCHPESKIAVELEGGVWINGRHGRGSGFVKDCEKLSEAAAMGYRVFKLEPAMINADWVERIIKLCKETK
jgi:very-short-patch-repair endonuclease